jgi:hypothetical protein
VLPVGCLVSVDARRVHVVGAKNIEYQVRYWNSAFTSSAPRMSSTRSDIEFSVHVSGRQEYWEPGQILKFSVYVVGTKNIEYQVRCWNSALTSSGTENIEY